MRVEWQKLRIIESVDSYKKNRKGTGDVICMNDKIIKIHQEIIIYRKSLLSIRIILFHLKIRFKTKRISREEAYQNKGELLSGWLTVELQTKTPLIIPDGAHPKYWDINKQRYISERKQRN